MSSAGEQIVNRFVTTLNERDFDGFEALFVDDYQQHQALASTTGNPAAKHAVRMYYQDRITAFPDMVVTASPTCSPATTSRSASSTGVRIRARTWVSPPPAGRSRSTRPTSCASAATNWPSTGARSTCAACFSSSRRSNRADGPPRRSPDVPDTLNHRRPAADPTC